jgi:hypothetical protein
MSLLTWVLFSCTQNNSHDCVHMDLPLTAEDLKGINLNKAAPILQVLSHGVLSLRAST